MSSLYLIMMNMDFVISNEEIRAAATLVSPSSEEVNYNEFVNKIF